MRRTLSLASLLSLVLALMAPSRGGAEMWCADPLWAHEWGVVVHGSSGAQRGGVGPVLPTHFHARTSTTGSALGPPVRDMPVDGGERELPVLHFYSPSNWRPIPLGLQVGFTHGEASLWYPQVDARRSAADANGSAARTERDRLVASRAARTGLGPFTPLPRDPTRQLSWDHLVLEDAARTAPPPSTIGWVQRLRGFDRALWVNGAAESERFVFYEARTRETPAIRVTRGPTFAAGRRHYILENVSTHPVHDVLLVHREAAATYVLHAPSIPAGRSAGFVLEDHTIAPASLDAATRGAVRASLVDSASPTPPTDYRWGGARGCVMQRDPAQPVERAADHRLYAHEADALLEVWGARAFDAQGTTIVYREDVALLDEVMPLTIHTDMYHFVELRRASLALMENVALP